MKCLGMEAGPAAVKSSAKINTIPMQTQSSAACQQPAHPQAQPASGWGIKLHQQAGGQATHAMGNAGELTA
jgi:hypothetical protein